MGWVRRWVGSSWRARVGWVLLGVTLATVSVALPVWAVAGANVDVVAGWANVLALPITAMGLVLVLVDRRGTHEVVGSSAGQRRPWMAPPLDRMVPRPELGERLVSALMADRVAEVGLTTGLHGAGGFGKTRLATWLCHRPEIDRRYPGGLLWVTVGQEIHGADLAERINDVAFVLSGERPAIADPDLAGGELGRLLDERPPVLLVVDDVWSEAQLRPFRIGGRQCTRLVTTRLPDLLPATVIRIPVDAMSHTQAVNVVADQVPGLPVAAAAQLARLAGHWPVLLNLVNGALRRRIVRGQSTQAAATAVMASLVAHGPAVFDPAQPTDRGQAVRATVEASVQLLDRDDRDRYFDLAIFPEDVEVSLDVLALLWPGRAVDGLVEELVGLGLVADCRLDAPSPRLILHDVIRAYLRAERPAAMRAAVHGRLIDAATVLLPADSREHPSAWWLLPSHAGYLWRHLPWHLREADRLTDLTALLGDLRWTEAKTNRFGSVVAVEADLALADTLNGVPGADAIDRLRRVLRRDAHMLGPIDPPTALGATLASRLHGVAGLEPLLEPYRAALSRPLLEPTDPPPDLSRPEDHAGAIGHTGAVAGCAISPDGTLLASASYDTTIRLWRLPDGAQLAVLTGHSDAITGCAISPDGLTLATTSQDTTVRLWHLPQRHQYAVLTGHTARVNACAFAPDGTLLATAGQDATIRLWHLPDGSPHKVLTGHTEPVNSVAFSPDGTLLASTSDDRTTRLWRMPDANEHAVIHSHRYAAEGCVFSPDGSWLAAGDGAATIRLWRMPDAPETATLPGHADSVLVCAFSPDGQLLASASWDQTVRLWRVPDGAHLRTLTGHTSWVLSCVFTPDGSLLASGSEDATVRLWRMPDGRPHAVLARGTSPVVDCSFTPDGTLLATGGYDATPRLWPVNGGTPTELAGHTSRILGCAVSPDGQLLATTSHDKTVRLWRMPDGRPHSVLSGHTSAVTCCAFSPDGTLLATTSYDRTVRLWQMPDGKPAGVLSGHTRSTNRCAFSPDGAFLATTSSDTTVRLWRTPSGEAAAILTGHTRVVEGCAFSPDGSMLATASFDNTVRLWDLPEGTPHRTLHGHTNAVERCAFSCDGATLATVSNDRTLRMWEVATGECRCAIRVTGPLFGLAWHPDGDRLCATGAAGIYHFTYRPAPPHNQPQIT